MSSVLEKEFIPAKRPYSQKELIAMRGALRMNLRLGHTFAQHTNSCGHFYLTKHNGRKERKIRMENQTDPGACSVCWKFSKTPPHLKDRAQALINFYCSTFSPQEQHQRLTYNLVTAEEDFYTWLYEDFSA